MKTYSADDDAPSLELETDEADAAPQISSTETDWDRKDRAFTLVEFGRPRTVQLTSGPFSVMRLTDDSPLERARDLAFDKASDAVAKRRLLESPDQPLTLEGPASLDAIDAAIRAVFEAFPHFGPALQAIRVIARLNLSRGASWLSFRPLLIISPPGCGKTSVACKLASNTALPMVLLDGSTMTTATPLLGGVPRLLQTHAFCTAPLVGFPPDGQDTAAQERGAGRLGSRSAESAAIADINA